MRCDDNVAVSEEGIQHDTGNSANDVITLRWVDDFCDRYRVRVRNRIGNKTLSPQEISRNKSLVAFHFGLLKRSYDDGLDPSTVENFDKTHMLVDMDNNNVLDIQGTKYITYSEVSSGRDCFTVCFRITGADGARIEAPFVIF